MEIFTTGAEVKTERERQGISRDVLAKWANLTDRSHVRKIEEGEVKDPKLSTMVKLSEALGVSARARRDEGRRQGRPESGQKTSRKGIQP